MLDAGCWMLDAREVRRGALMCGTQKLHNSDTALLLHQNRPRNRPFFKNPS